MSATSIVLNTLLPTVGAPYSHIQPEYQERSHPQNPILHPKTLAVGHSQADETK